MSSIMREDWIEVELGDLLKLKNGFAFQATNYKKEGIPVFRIGDINDWIVSAKNSVKIEEKEVYDEYIVETGDILIAMSGATTGKFGIYHSTEKAYQNQRVGNLKLYSKNSINKSFVFYLLYSLKRDIERDAYGGAQPNISGIKIEALKTKLAPLPIQRAIVSKIEALFSDLDNGIANFKKAQEQLKIYRQAVLKKAFEGKLSELGKVGLKDDRIADAEDKEKILKSNNPKNPNSDNKEDNLPKGWKWVKISDVCDMKAGYFIKADEINSEFENGLFPCYGGNGLRGYVKSTTHEGLFPIVGRQGALCGNVHLVNGKFHATEHAVVVTAKKEIDIKCLYYKLTEMKINQYATGTAQPGLSVNKILPIEIIYPSSFQEQIQIVQEIESRLSVCDKMEQSINESIEKAEALRQSILKKAFEGKLLSQAEIELCKKETDYEPASELLKKIQAEKLAKELEKKKPTVKKKSKK